MLDGLLDVLLHLLRFLAGAAVVKLIVNLLRVIVTFTLAVFCKLHLNLFWINLLILCGSLQVLLLLLLLLLLGLQAGIRLGLPVLWSQDALPLLTTPHLHLALFHLLLGTWGCTSHALGVPLLPRLILQLLSTDNALLIWLLELVTVQWVVRLVVLGVAHDGFSVRVVRVLFDPIFGEVLLVPIDPPRQVQRNKDEQNDTHQDEASGARIYWPYPVTKAVAFGGISLCLRLFGLGQLVRLIEQELVGRAIERAPVACSCCGLLGWLICEPTVRFISREIVCLVVHIIQSYLLLIIIFTLNLNIL